MRLLEYRGRKIRKWDDRLFLWSVILYLIFATVMIILVIKYQGIYITVSKYPIIGQAVTVLSCDAILLITFWLVLKKQETIYENLENRQALARMIIGNEWFETDMKNSSKGQQDMSYLPRLYYWKRRSITYFPKMYYRKKNGKIYITVKISMGRYQEQLLHLEAKVETGLDCEIAGADYRHKWMYYTFLCEVEKSRINIEDMQADSEGIRFMQHIRWDFARHPHALIAGETGSGKTYFLLSIIETLLDKKAKLFIVDAKNSDLAGLEAVIPDVYYKEEDIKECIYSFYENMTSRMAEMKGRSDYIPGKNYNAYGLTENFLIFDEYVAYMEMLPKKEWEEVISVLKRIVLLGRQAGFFLILACQRPDAKYLPDGIRGQFGFRVALGNMEDSGYTMMFGSSEKNFVQKDFLGRGYVKLWNGIITEFYAPLVPPDHDFIRCIKDKGDLKNITDVIL